MIETLTIQDWQNFIIRYNKFTLNNSQLRFSEFKNRFDHLKTALYTITKLSNEIKKQYANNFNLFLLLGVERKEVATHSTILADLLNPQGTHCQNDIFLKAFLLYCSQKFGKVFPKLVNQIVNYTWFVDKEKVTAFGNLDIVLSCPDLQFLLVIENKIDAGEQRDQLMRYAQWIETQKMYFKNRILIYLTPNGSESFTAHEYSYYKLSYYEDITNWLKQALVEIQAPRIREAILQYIEIITTL